MRIIPTALLVALVVTASSACASGTFINASKEEIDLYVHYNWLCAGELYPRAAYVFQATLKPGEQYSGALSVYDYLVATGQWGWWVYQAENFWWCLFKDSHGVYPKDRGKGSSIHDSNSNDDCYFLGRKPVLPDSLSGGSLANTIDPINAMNGNVLIDESPDIRIPAAGMPLEFRRFYRSLETKSIVDIGTNALVCASLGNNWTHTYAWTLGSTNYVDAGTQAVVKTGDGRVFQFKQNPDGTYQSAYDCAGMLAFTNGKTRLRFPGGVDYIFNGNRLESIADPWCNRLTLTYSSDQLTRVEHSDGRAINLSYGGARLVRIDTPSTNLFATYGYLDGTCLTNAAVMWSGGAVPVRYVYTTTNAGDALVLTQRVNALSETADYTYATNESGQRTACGMGIALSSNIYQHQIDYPARSGVACVSYAVGASNKTFTLNYDADVFMRVKSVVITNGSTGVETSMYGYDYDGNLTDVSQYGGGTNWTLITRSQYDAWHRVTNEAAGFCTEPTNAWAYTWDDTWLLPTCITDPEGHRVTFEYANGSVSRARSFITDTATADTTYGYTSNGLLAAVTNANGHWVKYQYNGHGYPTQTFSQVGLTNWMTWDILGHLKEIRLPSTEHTTNEPPAMVPRVIAFDTDELGRLRQITWPDTSVETFAFDAIGNLTNHMDVAGRTTRFAWLPTRKLASTTRFLTGTSNQAATIGMEYDQQMNVVKVRDELERDVETYQLDLQDRPVKVTNVETQEMTVAYGLGDMVSQLARFDGSSVSLNYDEGARLKTLVYPDATLDFSYLKNGLLLTASTSLGAISNAYDGANRLILTKGAGPTPQSSTVTYHLDAVGNPTNTQATGLGYEVRRTFDAGERLSALAAGDVGAIFTYGSVNGLLASMTYTNGIVCGYGYDELDRLRSMTWRDASNNVLRSRGYSYTLAGMISRVDMESGERVEYTYDSLDRLTSEKRLDPHNQTVAHELYEYDLAGNRTKKTLLDGSSSPLMAVNSAFATGNRLAYWSVAETDLVGQVDVAGVSSEIIGTNDRFGWLYVSNHTSGTSIKPYISGTNFWVYDLTVGLGTQKVVAAIRDAAGNTTRVTNELFLTVVTNGTYQYSDAGCATNIAYGGKDYSSTIGLIWDGQYQLTAVATNGSVAERHGYDALGRRVWTWDAANGTNWMVYDGAQVVADVSSSGGLVRSYVWGPGIDNLLAMTVHGTATNTYYYLKDHLNSVLALVNSAGQIVEQYRYDAWGRTTVFDASGNPLSASAVGNRYCWQGREYSWNTGLHYFRARWYDPVSGRFISKDPSGIANGLNEYVALNNNPVNFIDPTGEAAIEAYDYWSGVGVAGQDAGGVLGNLQTAGASVMMSFIDFWGARDVEGSAGLSGYYSGSDECKGKSWGYGLYAAGMIGINAIPGGGKGVRPIAGKITGYTSHGLNQAISRNLGRGVHPGAILDAVRNPTKTVLQANGTIKYVGRDATVVLNQEGKVVTTWGIPRSP